MRCSNCNATAKIDCAECGKHVCRFHGPTVFNEATRKFVNLCGACYSLRRKAIWVREKS